MYYTPKFLMRGDIMKLEEFKELATETQMEYNLFCHKRKCEDCAIYKMLKDHDCVYISCTIIFAAYKLLNDFDFNLIEQINKELVAFSNERTCTYKGCELEKFKLDNPFLFCYVEEKKEREYFIECSLLFAIAYLEDCMDLFIN